MIDRLRCLVPHCRCTTKAGRFDEWICAKHWRLTSKVWRRRRALFRRRGRFDLANRMWDRLKDQAIERAAGL